MPKIITKKLLDKKYIKTIILIEAPHALPVITTDAVAEPENITGENMRFETQAMYMHVVAKLDDALDKLQGPSESTILYDSAVGGWYDKPKLIVEQEVTPDIRPNIAKPLQKPLGARALLGETLTTV
ncbi:MAG: hypothetical protein WAW80_01245 [Candidatus Saccharimonadales bacterium]